MARIYDLNPRGVTRPQQAVVRSEWSEEAKKEWRQKRNGLILAIVYSIIVWALIIAFGVWVWNQLSK